MKAIAHIISYLFHPIFIPFYMVMSVLYLPSYAFSRYTTNFKNILIVYIFFLDILVPLAGLWFMKKKGIISSLQIPNGQERGIPYFFLFFIYMLTAASLHRIQGLHPAISSAFYIIAAIILVIAIINSRWFKISAHGAAIGGATAWLFILFEKYGIDSFNYFLISIILSGIIMSSRLILGAHDNKEIYFGYSIGLLCVGLSFYVF